MSVFIPFNAAHMWDTSYQTWWWRKKERNLKSAEITLSLHPHAWNVISEDTVCVSTRWNWWTTARMRKMFVDKLWARDNNDWPTLQSYTTYNLKECPVKKSNYCSNNFVVTLFWHLLLWSSLQCSTSLFSSFCVPFIRRVCYHVYHIALITKREHYSSQPKNESRARARSSIKKI